MKNSSEFKILRQIAEDNNEFITLTKCSDAHFEVDKNGVQSIIATGDRKVEFIIFKGHILAYVNSALGYPAYYQPHWTQCSVNEHDHKPFSRFDLIILNGKPIVSVIINK